MFKNGIDSFFWKKNQNLLRILILMEGIFFDYKKS